jgi:hypothetical protein
LIQKRMVATFAFQTINNLTQRINDQGIKSSHLRNLFNYFDKYFSPTFKTPLDEIFYKNQEK